MNVVAINKGEVDQGQLRPPSQVMRLDRIGAFHPCRLSFDRVLLRRMHRDGWSVRRPVFTLDDRGVGIAVYTAEAPAADLSLVCFSQGIGRGSGKTRTTAATGDAAFVLYDGVPDDAEIERLRRNVPLQEDGRFESSEYVLSRANWSPRVLDAVVGALAAGRQPDGRMMADGGCLMDSTAVYANGKFGMADFDRTIRVPGLAGPFQAEMLCLYLMREFSLDIADRLAAARGGTAAASLSPESRNLFGIGNMTGIGMAPYPVTHPVLLDRWIVARETAIARVTALDHAKEDEIACFRDFLGRARAHAADWWSADPEFSERLETLREDLTTLEEQIASFGPAWWREEHPWARLVDWVERNCDLEAQELVNSLIMESYPQLVDSLSGMMRATDAPPLDAQMPLTRLLELIERHYGWALAMDFTDPRTEHFFWYLSTAQGEPRLGTRAVDPGMGHELRIGMAREIVRLHTALIDDDDEADAKAGDDAEDGVVATTAAFLRRHPEQRGAVRRVQTIARHPYGEIRDNILHADCSPADMLRLTLSFLGGSRYDPRPGHVVRSVFFQGAPTADRLTYDMDDWAFATISRREG